MKEKNLKSPIVQKINFLIINTFFVNKLFIYEFDAENPEKIIPSPLNLSFRLCQRCDIDSIDSELYDYSESAKHYSKHQFDQGDRCILAINNDRIIGYVWIMKNNMELSIHNHVPISAKRSYIYKGFVINEFRGNRVLNALDKYVIGLLKQEGKKFIVTSVSFYNEPSLRARERMGFRRIGTILQIRFLGLKYDYIPKKQLQYLQGL
jgi:hypothetical protein